MADIRNNFVGIKSPNPFWLASAPPTDKAYNVERAFKAGWGGVITVLVFGFLWGLGSMFLGMSFAFIGLSLAYAINYGAQIANVSITNSLAPQIFVFEQFLGERRRTLFHGHSFTGNQLGCAVSLASLELMPEVMAALPAKHLLPGHGETVSGEAAIKENFKMIDRAYLGYL